MSDCAHMSAFPVFGFPWLENADEAMRQKVLNWQMKR
jgi:hypothetical protein